MDFSFNLPTITIVDVSYHTHFICYVVLFPYAMASNLEVHPRLDEAQNGYREIGERMLRTPFLHHSHHALHQTNVKKDTPSNGLTTRIR